MRCGHVYPLICTFVLAVTGNCVAQSTMVPWLTRSADNSRSGWNQHETILTQASVESKGIVRATIIPVFGDARGMEAQPLVLPHVKTARGTRDVMVLPSMADIVRGVDAHDGSEIWQVTLGMPVTGSQNIDSHQINQFWGCLSTGVIDADTQRLYQVCWVSPDDTGSPQSARYFMFVLNVADGSQVVPKVLIGPSGKQGFNATMRKQRSSLVETNVNGMKTVFGCSGTTFETGPGASGYCFAFDAASNTVSALLAMTAGEGAGVWMAGQGAVADAQGFLYVVTGNGDFDGVSQWGESFLKLKYTPSSGGVAASLQVVDHWTPWTDFARTGQTAAAAAAKLAGVSASTEALKPVGGGMKSMPLMNAKLVTKVSDQGTPVLLVFPQMAAGNWS
ncbi:MAG: hypothetical protein WAL71_18700, partial [Terriglobales bacterium]